jgi:hypothetical protein
MIGTRIAGLFEQSGNFFFGFCVLVGAAFVAQRSTRAAWLIALGGLCFMLAQPIHFFLTWANGVGQVRFVLNDLVMVGSHVALFGGLAGGVHVLAKEASWSG